MYLWLLILLAKQTNENSFESDPVENTENVVDETVDEPKSLEKPG